jgi:hypothetical protein
MYNILTLKHGTKYSAEYVNKMYNMIHRHVTMPYNFYCFTEDSSGLNPNINIRPLPAEFPISGWWYKTYLFRKEHFTSGTLKLPRNTFCQSHWHRCQSRRE